MNEHTSPVNLDNLKRATNQQKALARDEAALATMTDLLVECIHCGLCLEACPTYVEIGREEDSPRGRIYMMRSIAEGRSDLDPSVLDHLDVCLGCRACETACPSGVQYGHLLEVTRGHIERDHKRAIFHRVARRLLLETFTRPQLLAIALFFGSLPSRLLGRKPVLPGGVLSKMIGASGPGGSLHLSQYPKLLPSKLPQVTPSRGPRKLKIGLLEGCVMPVLFDEVNQATLRVFTKLGCEVVVPDLVGCCGALHVHNGYLDDAAKMAIRNIEAFDDAGCDLIAVNSAGCGSTMKEYASLFPPGSDDHARAVRFSRRVKDVSEIIVDLLPGARLRELPITVTYHDACHLAHGQKVRMQPRQMLAAIPGLALIPLPESDHCCGSAGIYSFTQPDIAKTLQSRKLRHINSTSAQIVATGNPGCQMWIESGLQAEHSPIKALHPIQILDMALL